MISSRCQDNWKIERMVTVIEIDDTVTMCSLQNYSTELVDFRLTNRRKVNVTLFRIWSSDVLLLLDSENVSCRCDYSSALSSSPFFSSVLFSALLVGNIPCVCTLFLFLFLVSVLSAVLCCTVVCCLLCCGVLWCAVVCCGVLWCAVVCCAVLCCAVLCCVCGIVDWSEVFCSHTAHRHCTLRRQGKGGKGEEEYHRRRIERRRRRSMLTDDLMWSDSQSATAAQSSNRTTTHQTPHTTID